jgi:hypothetical protein
MGVVIFCFSAEGEQIWHKYSYTVDPNSLKMKKNKNFMIVPFMCTFLTVHAF